MVTSFLLLSEEKIKKEKEKVKESQKSNDSPKRGKRGAKAEQYLEEHIESAIWAVFACADDRLVPNRISTIHIT